MKCYSCKANVPDGASTCPICGKPQGFEPKTIRAAVRGDEAALTELYEKTYSSVYNTIKFMVRDEDAALDILQDSYVKAFRSLDTLQDPARFGAWMRRIAHNRAIDYLRQQRTVSLGSLVAGESGDEVELEDDRTDNLPEVAIDKQETTRLLGEILDALPDDQRVCVTMYYYDQLSVREIADELGVSEATIKSRLMYGRKKIEQQVKALERRGVRLYGAAPAALLMWLFRTEQAQAATLPAAGALQAVLGETGFSSAAGAVQSQVGVKASEATARRGTTAAAAGAGSTLATAAGMSLTTKLVAAATAIALVGGGAFAMSRMRQPPEPPSALPAIPLEDPYHIIWITYADRLEAQPKAFLREYDAGRLRYYDARVNNELLAEHFRNQTTIWYAFVDLNGDGVDEMLVGTKGDGWTKSWDLYTKIGTRAVPLLFDHIVTEESSVLVLPDGTLWLRERDGADYNTEGFYRIADDCSGLVSADPVDTSQGVDPMSLSGAEIYQLSDLEDSSGGRVYSYTPRDLSD